MNYRNRTIEKKAALAGAICSSLLIGICAIPQAGVAQRSPYSTRINESLPATPQSQPPLPESQASPIARIQPMNGLLNIRLTNETGDSVTYQLIGDTKPRILSGRSEIVLRNLQAPLTLTFQRPEGGLLRVDPQVLQPGMLEVTLDETTDLGVDKNALMVEKDGLIFVQ